MISNNSSTQENTCLLNDYVPLLNCPNYMTRADETRYYKLNQTQKEEYLIDKYFTLSHLPNLYINYYPNVNEFFNNAAWRIAIDTFIETYVPGLDSDSFRKEVAYNLAGMPSAVTSAILKLNIGSSNNTYTWNHALYSVERGTLKTAIVGADGLLNPEKREIKGGLDTSSTVANYIVDAITRHIPFATERLQADPDADVSSTRFYEQSIVSAEARTAGSQFGSYIFSCKLKPLVNFIFFGARDFIGLSSATKYIAATIPVSKEQPIENLIKLIPTTKTTIARVSEDCKKGAFTCAESLLFELAYKISFNFIGAIIQQPASRITGIFSEEVFEYYFPTNNTISGEVDSPKDEL